MKVSVVIPASPERVWADLRHVGSHVEWMDDAVAIRITSAVREGVGTAFDCDTRVGPFTLTDKMVVTEWREGAAMGIRHTGLVTGTGRFTLTRRGRRATRLCWEEKLVFPWWMGGPVGALIGIQALRRVWRRNLRNLRARFA